MKTKRITQLMISTFGFFAFVSAGCAEKEKAVDAALPPPGNTSGSPTSSPGSSPGALAVVAPASWSDVKDFTFDTRALFHAGLERLEARVDAQISELNAKRAAMKGTTSTKDWDFAMKEMEAARIYLQSTGTVLVDATSETWDGQKDRVGRAWVRTQNAYDKVKASTTK